MSQSAKIRLKVEVVKRKRNGKYSAEKLEKPAEKGLQKFLRYEVRFRAQKSLLIRKINSSSNVSIHNRTNLKSVHIPNS